MLCVISLLNCIIHQNFGKLNLWIRISFIILFLIDLYKDNYVCACVCVCVCNFFLQPFPKRQILDSSKLKEFAENNFKFDGNGGKFIKGLKRLWEKEKLLVTSNISFSHIVFNRLVLQTRKNQGLFGKGLKNFSSETIDWIFTKFHRNVPWIKV